MIVLAAEIAGGEAPILPLLDVTVERNAFGRQLDSFEAELPVPVLGDTPVHAVFIRAPIIERTGPGVDVLARLDDGRIVAVRERNVIATAFHPELAGETRFHRLVATMAAEHDDPGRGLGPAPAPDAPGEAAAMTEARAPRDERQGPAGAADRPRRARRAVAAVPGGRGRHAVARAAGQRARRSACSACSACRSGAFRPNDLMYVYEEDGRLAGLVRVERETSRDEWTIVELDAVGMADAGDIRFRLVQQLLREGAKRGAVRFHVACADADGNVELFMQAGFMRYGEERDPRPAGRSARCRRRGRTSAPPTRGIRPAAPLDALALVAAVRVGHAEPGRAARGDPAPRLGAPGRALARARARASRRSCGSPTSRRSSRRRPTAAATAPSCDGFVQIGVAKEDQPHYLKVIARPEADSSALVGFGLGVIAARTAKDGAAPSEHGVIAPVRTYESPIDRRLEEAGFDSIASVTLLMKETLVRVAEPALVPAGVR